MVSGIERDPMKRVLFYKVEPASAITDASIPETSRTPVYLVGPWWALAAAILGRKIQRVATTFARRIESRYLRREG